MYHKLFWAAVMTTAIAVSGCATTHGTSPEAEMDKAVTAMTNGYTELGKVANNLDRDQMHSAKQHFNKAMKDFDLAIEHFAAGALPPDDKPAVAELKKGLHELEKCVRALEKNDIGKAQTDYDNAQAHFANAAVLLD